jgi:hypothetical protein
MHPEAERLEEVKTFIVELVRRGGGEAVSLDAIRTALQSHPLIPLCYRCVSVFPGEDQIYFLYLRAS